jgi:hypothetical protein
MKFPLQNEPLYLIQSIDCTLIFCKYGLGFFGQMGAAAGIGLTIVIYALQIPFSHCWMRRFLYGPAEWLCSQRSRSSGGCDGGTSDLGNGYVNSEHRRLPEVGYNLRKMFE